MLLFSFNCGHIYLLSVFHTITTAASNWQTQVWFSSISSPHSVPKQMTNKCKNQSL